MDTTYDPTLGVLKLSMKSYIEMTMERFANFDLTQGYPYRELVGCLLWVTLNVMGPELLRVKDLARLFDSFGELEYNVALKVLKRIYVRRHHGIVIFRHAAGTEIVPSSLRLVPIPSSGENSGEKDHSEEIPGEKGQAFTSMPDDTGIYIPVSDN
jgi:hypothetical protein